MDGIRLIRRLYRSQEPRVLRDASVVATTVALSQLSPLIHGNRFDRIIVDEASVVRTPEAILAALMFGAPVTFFGDPMQLPSVVRSRTPESDQWLRPNPFQMAGIRGPEQARGACVMLDEQHRMATPIRHLVSDLFYGGALKDAQERTDGRILLLDTSATPARATTRWVRMSRSRENQVHRDVVASLLEAVKQDQPDASVLVVAPFRAQVQAYAREANTNRFRRVRFETVHRSQGTEADTVILDLVVAPSRGRSKFLDEKHTPELRNLLNVGISRAKRQLVVVAHSEEVQQQYPGSLLSDMLRRVESLGQRIVLPGNLRMQSVWKQAFGED